jgi:hypothetical protein
MGLWGREERGAGSGLEAGSGSIVLRATSDSTSLTAAAASESAGFVVTSVSVGFAAETVRRGGVGLATAGVVPTGVVRTGGGGGCAGRVDGLCCEESVDVATSGS